jgi:general secretion pathway protein G
MRRFDPVLSRGTANARRRRRRAAFTLIEIMAVVLIMGLLMGIVGTVVFSQVDKARVTTATTQIRQLEAALDFYRMDNGRYPTTEQGLDALVHKPGIEPEPRFYRPEGYLQGGRLPNDPWGETYQYLAPGTQNPHAFDLWSLGADGKPGGEGTDSDVGNWVEEETS